MEARAEYAAMPATPAKGRGCSFSSAVASIGRQITRRRFQMSVSASRRRSVAKSRSADHNSRTPCCRHSAATRASWTCAPAMRPSTRNARKVGECRETEKAASAILAAVGRSSARASGAAAHKCAGASRWRGTHGGKATQWPRSAALRAIRRRARRRLHETANPRDARTRGCWCQLRSRAAILVDQIAHFFPGAPAVPAASPRP